MRPDALMGDAMSQAATERQLSRRLAAVMFTDMAGYTALMQRDETAALRSRERHRNAVDGTVPQHGGEVLQYFGDGSLSLFASSVQAVEAAIEIQRSLGGEPPLRIGLHLGDVAYDEQGAYGDAINVASRLEALSVPGGILVSEKVYDEIKPHPRLTAVPTGAAKLKHATHTVRTFAVTVDGVKVPPGPVGVGTVAGLGRRTSPLLPQELHDRLEARMRHPHLASATGAIPGRVPLVGRDPEIGALRARLDEVATGQGSTLFFRGPRGVGKSRLGQEAAEYTRARGWTVLSGRAYPAEGMAPFAPFWDAFLPILKGLSDETIAWLVPGGEDVLYSLFPGLGAGVPKLEAVDGEPQARLFWHFANLVNRLADYRPLLLIIEDLDFADHSSIELFHFLARQCPGKPVCLIGQYTGSDPDRRRELLAVEQSLVAMNAGSVFQLDPLGEGETDEFIRRGLGIEGQDTGRLASMVHDWTGGNPFFLAGTLRGLVESRVLRRESRVWRGLDVDELQLPRSQRDAVLNWLGSLSEPALRLARLVAVAGTRMTFEVLAGLWDRDADQLVETLDELLRNQILVDTEERFTLVYDFRHSLIREALRSELTLSQRRLLHRTIGERLEAYYGEHADRHADELAYHFGRANPGEAGAGAVHYLATAGLRALERHANHEAVAYLQEAFDRIEARLPGELGAAVADAVDATGVMAALARGRRRLGDFQESAALARRVLAVSLSEGDLSAAARARREIGLSFLARGLFEEAIEELEHAVDLARSAPDEALVVRLLLALGYCHHAAGHASLAEGPVLDALALAERLGRPDLVGRVHGALMRLHIWTGRLTEVRAHAEKALAPSGAGQDTVAEFWSQWAMGAMEGLIGNTAEMERHIAKASLLADQIGSPMLRLEIAELEAELAYARGDWSEGLANGERAIELARSLDARSVLPRLLVWVSFIHLGRGSLAEADRLTREAWDLSGAEAAGGSADYFDVHTVLPAHIGRAAYHLTSGAWGDAARIAEAGLAIADRTGYVVWAIHHILPILAEVSLHARNLTRAREVEVRMRAESQRMGHPLGIAWADATDAVLTWLEGDAARGAVALRQGAEAMEAVPLVYEASRIRRQLAGRLAEIGKREEALQELWRVHDVFRRLGAKPELERTEGQLRELGAQAPPRRPTPGPGLRSGA